MCWCCEGTLSLEHCLSDEPLCPHGEGKWCHEKCGVKGRWWGVSREWWSDYWCHFCILHGTWGGEWEGLSDPDPCSERAEFPLIVSGCLINNSSGLFPHVKVPPILLVTLTSKMAAQTLPWLGDQVKFIVEIKVITSEKLGCLLVLSDRVWAERSFTSVVFNPI